MPMRVRRGERNLIDERRQFGRHPFGGRPGSGFSTTRVELALSDRRKPPDAPR